MTAEEDVSILKRQIKALISLTELLAGDVLDAHREIDQLRQEKITTPMPRKRSLPDQRRQRLAASLEKLGGKLPLSPQEP